MDLRIGGRESKRCHSKAAGCGGSGWSVWQRQLAIRRRSNAAAGGRKGQERLLSARGRHSTDGQAGYSKRCKSRQGRTRWSQESLLVWVIVVAKAITVCVYTLESSTRTRLRCGLRHKARSGWDQPRAARYTWQRLHGGVHGVHKGRPCACGTLAGTTSKLRCPAARLRALLVPGRGEGGLGEPLGLTRMGAGAGAARGATSGESGCEKEGGLRASKSAPSRQRRSIRPQAAVLELGGESGGPGSAPFMTQLETSYDG